MWLELHLWNESVLTCMLKRAHRKHISKEVKGKYVLCWDILSICRPTCVPGVSVLRVIKLFRLLYRYNSLHNYYQSGLFFVSLLPRVKLPNQRSGISSILNLRIGLFWIPERWFWCLWIKALVSQVFSNWVYLGYQSVDSQLTYFHTFYRCRTSNIYTTGCWL